MVSFARGCRPAVDFALLCFLGDRGEAVRIDRLGSREGAFDIVLEFASIYESTRF